LFLLLFISPQRHREKEDSCGRQAVGLRVFRDPMKAYDLADVGVADGKGRMIL
jgi:hypothetical protein